MKSTGKLRCSPRLLGDKNRDPKWWMILECDQEIGRYYRELYFIAHCRGEKLIRPAFKEHITVIRDEEPPENRKGLWWKYQGEEVEFDMKTYCIGNGDYFWLEVISPRLLDIRQELGLRRHPYLPLHLSIGHLGLGDL